MDCIGCTCMNTDNTESKVKTIIANVSGSSMNTITTNTNLAVDLGLNSFKFVELREKLESIFAISIFDEELLSFDNFSDLVQLIKSKLDS